MLLYLIMMTSKWYTSWYDVKHGKGFKVLTPKKIIQRLPIALAQVKSDNISEKFLKEIRQIYILCIEKKEITKKKYITI